MKKTLAALLLGLLAGCGNGSDPGSTDSAAPSPADRVTAAPSPSTSPAAKKKTTVELWFERDDYLFATHRDIPSTPAIGRATLNAWIGGPTPEEQSEGVHSAVPEGTELLGLEIEDGFATVDLSEDFEERSGTFGESMRLSQLAWTLTQFPTVDAVLLKIEGESKRHYMSHGFVIDREHPLKRSDDDPLLPAILVQEPNIGDRVSSPVVVSGTANVFEANVLIRIRDESGRGIFEGFTTATCGTGCRGEYSRKVRFDVDREQTGSIEAYEESAEDGSEINKVTIPVTLVP